MVETENSPIPNFATRIGLFLNEIKTTFYSNYKNMKYDLLKLFMVISKHTIYVLVLIWLGRPVIFAGEAAGQSIHDIMISIDLSDSPILEALNSIEEKTNFTFAYGRDVRELEAHINLAKDQISVGAALMHISMVTGIEFRQINNTISAKVQRGMDNNQFSKYRLQGEDQTAVIQGRVTDENGNPLPGATILEKGSTNGTVSDVDGNFQLEVPETAILTISFIGYIKYEIALNGETYLNIKLNLDSEALEEVVVVGYGTQTKKDITTSVGIISASDLQNQAISNIDQGMVGRLAGVQVTQSTGEPGVPTSIRIRGTKSITAGNGPLYVVDGVPLDQSFQVMQSIDPNDIESLTVLKDASAAAIYGSRGSNGVVVITTKRGKEGKMKVSYNSWIGVQQVSKKVKLLDAYQYAQLAKDGHDNAYIDEITGATIADPDNVRPAGYHKTPEDLLPYLNNESGLTNTDWQDEIFRRARITNHNVSLSGGKGGVNYFISGYYTKQDGIIIQSDFEKYGMKVNLETVADRLSAGVSFTPSYSVSNKVDAYGPYFDAGVVGTALQAAPVWSVYNPDGTYNFEMNGKWRIGTDYQHNEILNPVAIAHLVDDQVTRSNILSNAWVGYEIIEGLKAKLSVASNVNFNTEDYYRPSTLPDRGFNNYLNPSNPIARASSNDYKNLLLEGTLNFTRNFGDHAINLLSGYTIQKETRSFRSVTATNFPNDLVKTVNAGEVIDGTSTISEWGLVSFLSRAQYGYQSKYLVSAAIRADGSSRFAPNNKWGFFPSLSMGWRISQEEFLQGLSQINELKLRGSYGLTGNFQIGNYEYLSSLSSASSV
ncbi:MAG: TonB-linked SusC/RagA family outer membrane protein, partial [Cyclobacteriaceae bacterium]